MQEIISRREGDAYDVIGFEQIEEDEVEGISENNKLIFRPEFIPYYLKEIKQYGFTNTEGLVYGFVRFYLKNNPRGQFYFTNEQLAFMLDVSPSTISNCIQKVCKCGEFKVSYKIKANGGTFRLLENSYSDSEQIKSPTLNWLRANKNKINENKINKYMCDFDSFWKQYPKKVSKKKTEKIFNRLVTSSKKEQEIIKGLLKYKKKWQDEKTDIRYIPNPTTWLNQARWEDEVLISNEQYNKNARSFENVNENIKRIEREEYSKLRVDDGKGGLVRISEIIK